MVNIHFILTFLSYWPSFLYCFCIDTANRSIKCPFFVNKLCVSNMVWYILRILVQFTLCVWQFQLLICFHLIENHRWSIEDKRIDEWNLQLGTNYEVLQTGRKRKKRRCEFGSGWKSEPGSLRVATNCAIHYTMPNV